MIVNKPIRVIQNPIATRFYDSQGAKLHRFSNIRFWPLMNLFKTNLNLLKVFMVLMQEKNTSLAAKTLHITQPAISNSLSQLRDLFKDELFICENRIRGLESELATVESLIRG